MHPCISAEISRATLKPGQSTKLKITVDARFLKSAKSRRRILITTNDATHPKAFIDVTLVRSTPKNKTVSKQVTHMPPAEIAGGMCSFMPSAPQTHARFLPKQGRTSFF